MTRTSLSRRFDVNGIVERSDSYERLRRGLERKIEALPVCSDDVAKCSCSHLCGAAHRVMNHASDHLSQHEFEALMRHYKLAVSSPDDYYTYLTCVFWLEVRPEYDKLARENCDLHNEMEELMLSNPEAFSTSEYQRLHRLADQKLHQMVGLRGWVFSEPKNYLL